MAREADQPQCVALASILGLGLRIEQITAAPGDHTTHVDIDKPAVWLLYRPGEHSGSV